MLEFPKILKLISVRHLNGVIDEIEKGADVNVRDKLGRQPIHHAAKLKNASRPFFDLLFETGKVDINAVDKNNNTPIYILIEAEEEWKDYQLLELVEYLVEKGADPLIPTINNEYSFFHATKKGLVKTLNYLLSFPNVDINAKDKKNRGLLYYALFYHPLTLGQHIYDKGARTTDDQMILFTKKAILNKSVIILNLIYPMFVKQCPKQIDDNGRTMLIEAVENNSLDCVKLLVDFGESVDKRDREGRCALNFACKNNNLEMVEYLYSRCDPSLYLGHESFPADSGEFDSSPLHWCAQYNSDDKNLNCIEFFLRNGFTNIDCLAYSEEHGMKICPKKKYKFFTPLALSIYNGTYYLTRYLIKQGASVRPLNADVYPPLIAAFTKTILTNIGILPVLLNTDIDINVEFNFFHILFDPFKFVVLLRHGLDTRTLFLKPPTGIVEYFDYLVKNNYFKHIKYEVRPSLRIVFESVYRTPMVLEYLEIMSKIYKEKLDYTEEQFDCPKVRQIHTLKELARFQIRSDVYKETKNGKEFREDVKQLGLSKELTEYILFDHLIKASVIW